MAVKPLKLDSKFPSEKVNGFDMRCDSGFDRISQLPDSIIISILCFLPLKEAAATSVLSSRWSELWKHVPNLNFYAETLDTLTKECIPKYIEWVNSVIQSHKALSLENFTISFYVDISAQCMVNKWLEFVFSRRVERLELDFLCRSRKNRVVLDSSICQALTQTPRFFKSLKELCLRKIKLSGEAVELFLCNCPLLERLIIHAAELMSDVEVCGGASLVLKHLYIHQCSGGKTIKISAPNLIWLSSDDISGSLLLENVPKLVEADFTFTCRSQDTAQHFALAVNSCISQLEILTISLICSKVFLTSWFSRMPKLKKLVVNYYGQFEDSLLSLTCLIWASPCLEEFELKFIRSCRCRSGLQFSNVERLTLERLIPQQHLKVFQFTGFDGHAGTHMELLRYICDNCAALEKIFIRPTLAWDMIANTPAIREYAKQVLQGKVPTHIQLLIV
ncbi:hypothetical protein C2S52_000078 [Perilla frutescens var. hirtella]|nr:hypothetical protein C2S51_000159 [Perilla frutescens var. frutescens]KAH6786174.1 hypothetical protein C2S52_000078 [Perilla frutescens var. hirtella]